MQLKDYQVSTLDAFVRWREALGTAQADSEKAIAIMRQVGAAIPADIRNYPKTAWEQLDQVGGVAPSAGEYVSRTDAAGRPIPHVCFKVPTGGGKTLLAAAALERLNRQTGLTLWITPTRAIYGQTKAALKNKEHPYRQMLERASGGRVKLLEKDDLFTAADVANYLCVMLLMLPAANRRRHQEFLRMYRDSGRYPTFFPDNDDALGDGRLLRQYPDLQRTSDGGPVKHSLFNVFKMLRPVVVLDEAHKAYGTRNRESNEEFVRSVNRLDPRLVIELSATPNRGISNLLVDISGVELKIEEMIKLPVQVEPVPGTDWHHTLAQAHGKLEHLDAEAQSLQMSEGRYIRPIAVVRVERTGHDQRDGERVHAEDVRDHLHQNLGVPTDAIRIQSAEVKELGNEDLLSELSPVRWIITKSALMEGWDCPFAYLLVMLDNTHAQRAITQLVGRVMRQPHARRTGREVLDQCYVYCWNTDVVLAVSRVKNGLEQEGLTGIGDEVFGGGQQLELVTVQRRKQFRSKDIYFPMVLHQDGNAWIELDYQRHILPHIDWAALSTPDHQHLLLDPAKRQSATVDVGDAPTIFHNHHDVPISMPVSISWFTRRLSDIVPNAWHAARIAQQLIDQLRAAGETDDTIYYQSSYRAYELREHIKSEVESMAEQVFLDKLRQSEIRFDLEAGAHNFPMKESYEIQVGANDPTLQKYGRPMQLSLFEPVFKREFENELERKFARYLDEQKALQWWHRVAARQRGDYYLRGWKQERVWPDFIAMAGETGGKTQVLVFETKGEHMRDNPDTAYKQKVHRILEGALNGAFNAGKMTVRAGPVKGVFRLVFSEDEFPAALASLRQD